MSASPAPQNTERPNRFQTFVSAGFRFYFLSAGIFAVVAMLAWEIWLTLAAAGNGLPFLPIGMAPHLWHAHEMMFGYTAAVMAGFFVTAVPNWTGTPEAGAQFVAISGLAWLLGRLAVWSSGILDPVLVALVDLAFIPILSTAIFGRLTAKSQLRNLIFLFLLSALLIGNLLMHLDWLGWPGGNAEAGVRLGIFASAAMITIIGGRAVPAFTRNALNKDGHAGTLPQSHPWLDRPGILLALATTLACLPFVPPLILGWLCLAAGAVNLCRLSGWRSADTRGNPILWILHIAFLLLSLGYLVYGSSLLFEALPETAALHLVAVGAIGCMTLAMMTRASLGHSGRALKVPPAITIAYLAVIAAALVRTFGTASFDYYPVMLVSGALWLIAFGLYSWVFFPILTTPRSPR